METKRCANANHVGDPVLPVSEFYKRKRSKDGLHTWCRECCKRNARAHTPKAKKIASHRRSHMKLTYELSDQEFTKMLGYQDNACAICRSEFSDRKEIMIDHNHETGKVRGLLCRRCNTGLGFFDDDEIRLNAARGYVLADGVK